MAISKRDFIQHLSQIAPDIDKVQAETLISSELISPNRIELPKSVLEQAQKAVSDFFKLRQKKEFIASQHSKAVAKGLIDPGNYAICMSYDFHLNSEGQLKLIEVNTNASFLFLSQILYRAENLNNPVKEFGLNSIREMIETEVSLNLKERRKNKLKIAIVDHQPQEQKLYIEFLFAKSLFEQWGWECQILNPAEVDKTFDFVYNRSTDFYLETSESSVLRDLYMTKKACVSPNPFEYLMVADKERLAELSLQPELLGDHGKSVLLECKILTEANREQLWNDRKKYFFKPLRSFGAKQSYRGDSVARGAFDGLVSGETLAQEYVRPSEIKTADAGEFKYDLRFFSYQDRVQTAVARLYQGQVTNLRTPGGGFAAIKFQ